VWKQVLRTVWIGAGLSFTAWMVIGFQSTGVPGEVLRSNEQVELIAHEKGWGYRNSGGESQPAAGVIFLPGGMVDPVAYAPLLREIALAGYWTHLVALPWRCACTDGQVQDLFTTIGSVMQADSGQTAWILAGHSRGGMLAARFVRERGTTTQPLAGLALIGTTHPRDFSLAGITMAVTKIYGTRDGIASYAAMRANAQLLPPQTRWAPIEGGNHVQFGYYRHQLGDDSATISRAEQQAAVRDELLRMLSAVRR
jgi:pimeloyl-ACP methyl ester carboxylesterase